MAEDPYVELRGHRIPVMALAALWQEGASPETIHENYPTLSLAQVLGGLAFYLDHQDQVDADLKADEEAFERAREAARAASQPSRSYRGTLPRLAGEQPRRVDRCSRLPAVALM